MNIIRWIARILTVPIFWLAVAMVVVPDPELVWPVPLTDRIIIGFLYVSVLGLLIGWRWEGVGGAIAVAGVAGHVLAVGVFADDQSRALMGSALFGSVLLVPAILFLIYWQLGRGRGEAMGPSEEPAPDA